MTITNHALIELGDEWLQEGIVLINRGHLA